MRELPPNRGDGMGLGVSIVCQAHPLWRSSFGRRTKLSGARITRGGQIVGSPAALEVPLFQCQLNDREGGFFRKRNERKQDLMRQ